MSIKFKDNSTRPDGLKSFFGDANDLAIYHDGTNDYIVSNGTYNIFEANNHIFRNLASNEDYAKFIGNKRMNRYEDQLGKDINAIISDLKTYLKAHKYD